MTLSKDINHIELTKTSLEQLGYDVEYEHGLFFSLHNIPPSLVSFKKDGEDVKDLVIPSTYSYLEYTYEIFEIYSEVFYCCSSLTSVTIPNSVIEIGREAFKDCSSLTSITIPDSVKNIGYNAFRGCSSLTSVTIPDSEITTGYAIFDGCTSLKSVNVSNSDRKIDLSEFVHYPRLVQY